MQSLPFRFAVFSVPRHLTSRARSGTPKDIRRHLRRVTFPFLLYRTRYGVNCFAQPIAALDASVSPQKGAEPRLGSQNAASVYNVPRKVARKRRSEEHT